MGDQVNDVGRTNRRVLVVSRMFPHPDEPGVGPFIHEQVRALRRRGIDARVLCGRPFPLHLRHPLGLPWRWRDWCRAWATLAWDEWDGVPVVYAPYHVGWAARLLGRRDPYRDAIVRAGSWIQRRFDFDLIHAHTAHPDGHAALALARSHTRPLVMTEHTGPFSTITSTPLLRSRTLAALGAARRVWCVSHSLADEVRSYFPLARQAHIGTLGNGVDTELFRPPTQWRPDPTAPRLLFVGFLVPIKNVAILLDAFAQLRQHVPGATLDVAGSGPLRGALQQQAEALGLSDAVTFLGAQSRRALAERLRSACDLLVLPSRAETFGVVLIEALACGKPVVATRCGGPESVVTDSSLGALCPPNDAAALARCLRETVARLDRFNPAAIRAHAVRTFEYRVLAEALARQYDAVLAETAAPRASAA